MAWRSVVALVLCFTTACVGLVGARDLQGYKFRGEGELDFEEQRFVDKAIRTIEIKSDRFTIAFARNDGAQLGRFYTDDATLSLPGAPTVQGRGAIEAAWSAAFEQGGLRSVALDIDSITATGDGDTFVEKGNYKLKVETPEGMTTVRSTYEVLWTMPRQGDDARIIDDVIRPPAN